MPSLCRECVRGVREKVVSGRGEIQVLGDEAGTAIKRNLAYLAYKGASENQAELYSDSWRNDNTNLAVKCQHMLLLSEDEERTQVNGGEERGLCSGLRH